MQAGSTPTSTDSALLAELALSRGDLVQEWGYDDDVDVTFRDALEDALGEELLTEDDQEPADAVLFGARTTATSWISRTPSWTPSAPSMPAPSGS